MTSAYARILVAALAGAALLAPSYAKEETRDVNKLLLDSKRLPPITAAEMELTEVPFAKGAPAVILLQGRQEDLRQGRIESIRLRRVKLLTQAGVDEYSTYSVQVPMSADFERCLARVTLPDGRAIDAKENVRVDITEQGYRAITVTFPETRVGAILDFQYINTWDRDDGFDADARLPVLESRRIVTPLTFQRVANNLPGVNLGSSGVATSLDMLRGEDRSRAFLSKPFLRVFPLHVSDEQLVSSVALPEKKGAAISFRGHLVSISVRDLPPLPVEPMMPPEPDYVPHIVTEGTEYPDLTAEQQALGHFRSQATRADENATVYERRIGQIAKRLAESVTSRETTVRGKVNAIRAALANRVILNPGPTYLTSYSADATLTAGNGTATDITYLAMVMLRAVGVDAVPVGYHRRADGLTVPPQEFLTPTDVMLRISGEPQPFYWAPAYDLPPGLVPFQARGVVGIPYKNDKSERPLVVPLPPADERLVSSMTRGTLAADGTLSAETTWTYTGEAAAEWRGALRLRSVREQIELYQDELRSAAPTTAVVVGVDVPALDGGAPKMDVVVRWRAEGFAHPAGKRLVLPASPLSTIAVEDWAAEQRVTDVDLGQPEIRSDVITLTLPAGYTTLFPPRTSLAGPGAKFELTASVPAPGQLTITRTLRHDQPLYAAAQWASLRDFYLKAAAAEALPLVVEPVAN